MKISVCFKILPDYDQVSKDSWKSGMFLPDFRYVKKNFGVFDEGALETALNVKDKLKDTYLEAVCFGKEDSIFTEALYAAGYDSVVYLINPGSPYDNENTSRVLSRFLKSSSPDIVLCGEQAGPADSGTVPYLIASELNYAILDKVSALPVENGKLYFKRQTEEFEEKYLCDRRILAVVSSAEKAYLRFAEHSKKVAAEGRKARIVPIVTIPKIVKVVYERKAGTKHTVKMLDGAKALHDIIKGAEI